jgi:predicted nucleotidyltransferase/uncharacterized protein (UPF0332 family)
MVKKRGKKKIPEIKKPADKKRKPRKKPAKKLSPREVPTLRLLSEQDIAMDFATKAYEKFNKLIKSIILFGSSVKSTAGASSDVDIIIIIDDSAVQWDQELIAWYREELGKLIKINPYKKELHINSVKLTTWWQDLMRGDPVVINVIRYGESLIDFGGFFNPLKVLLQEGRIKSTPEAVYTCLQRAPQHLARSKAAELGAIEGIYWAMVDASHALLISAKILPPSPEHIPILLKENFVDKNLLKMKYVIWYRDLYVLHRKIVHGDITDIKGLELDEWQERTDQFIRVMAELIEKITEK